MKSKNLQHLPTWIWVVLPSILFVLAWEPIGITPFLFVAFLPLLDLHYRFLTASRWKYFGVLYLSIFGWNVTTTWWVFYASAAGGVAMLFLNTLFMTFPFLLWRSIDKKGIRPWKGFALFTMLWVLYEYGHHRWDLSWPWLTLGNGLSSAPLLIQWYEWTGTLGGSVWVLWVNFLLLYFLKSGWKKSRFTLLASLGFPVILSLGIYVFRSGEVEENQRKDGINVAVMQPSFNPWNEKFDRDPIDMQSEMQQISTEVLDSATDWLLWPETCLVRTMDVDYIKRNPQVLMLQRDLLSAYPNLQILAGFHGIEYYRSQSKPTRSARKSAYDPGIYYDVYNSALHLNKDSSPSYYHKSKLVPGTEQMPFIHSLPFLEELAISLDENSITGSLGISNSAYPLGYNEPVAPIICYESIYGDYVRGYIQSGATWLGIITNDAWWENTPGYHQHYSYAKLRAIEFRKWVARSANTGTSGFIDPLGHSTQESQWYAKTALKDTVYPNSIRTWYLEIGDLGFLGIYSLLLLPLLFIRTRG